MSLAERYAVLEGDRDTYLQRAYDCTKLTIPTLFPQNTTRGRTAGTSFPTPWQSMGARCVNNLAAKLLVALFPPNAPFFKLAIDDFTLEKLTQQEGMRAMVEEGLNKVERAVMTEMETTTSRPALFEALKQLIVGGNSLVVVSPDNHLRIFKLNQYVCKRDPMGNPLEIITKECISPLELSPELRALSQKQPNDDGKVSAQDDCELHTCYKLTAVGSSAIWKVWQELDGIPIASSRGTYPHDKLPARPLRWTSLHGEDYGRGMVEEYMGDFKSLEGLQKAIVQGAAAAAKVLFLVKPNSTTKKDVLSKSESGDVHAGNAEDVTVLQMQKYADFKFALDTRNELMQALSFAFMLNTAIQRQGERVTAEEIRFMAQELESTLGGIYSTMSQDLQLPLVTLYMNNMQRIGRMPALPKGVVRPAITTGIDAIGRGNDTNKLSAFVQSLEPLGPTAIAYINMGDFIKRMGTAQQIDMKGLVKPDAQVQQEQQQAQQAELLSRAAPNVVNKVGDHINQQTTGAPANG